MCVLLIIMRENYAGSEKPLPTFIQKKGATLVPGTIKLLYQEEKKEINGDQEGCRLDLKLSPDES